MPWMPAPIRRAKRRRPLDGYGGHDGLWVAAASAYTAVIARGGGRSSLDSGVNGDSWRCGLTVTALGEERRRIDRRRALADLEMHLRRRDAAGLAGLGDDLAALHGVVALDHDLAGMRVGGDIAVGVPDQHQVAVGLELVAGIGDDAV